ncbi:MAG: aldo/keto reductase [Stygiobacter sp. RIFOXYC12_FULL_38_8]|jgi:aryl-alcohol dehydrogenase-like predicted oxidoreductase|nr:aldo/keto reductase [Bacteroidota bacterium]MBX2975961.1 aldo/keto reductase [Ignavibacteriaceae bacterium]OGU80587.1 MAG: aldo/keto reductase [Stygiobacter sp. RIFOXYA12_FULL_38_9]OGV06837.1 MAG: aldo/keto reductase [Stygiobacter sp. RIFOXYB2_FULL_37_11]OGV10502.1 MAG: aldo/keto reductase [Stygiobacter sp. RIFOXYA2_FULL_38_8]OGV13296.1 MAG: aldo/keto reductase [Stygiobacter sp. RIFOXYC2_FULL_38_25]OGV30249.1 MAG: aldo/keto reductase [Stygiobacter sp. RIFOXYC12_FULL_38_8]OGV83342.1 MAG: a
MKYRTLGDTGVLISELCFGTMGFGGTDMWANVGKTQQDEADRLVGIAIDAGINFFDTANIYSTGISEQILGKSLATKRKNVILATKVRGKMGEGVNDVGLSRVHIMQQVDESLKRLGTDYIDLYQIHGFDILTPLEETLRALDDLVKSGKVRYIGCSNLTAWQLMKSLWISDKNGFNKFKSLQAYYSIAGRDLEREIVPLLKDQKLGLMVWSPLAGGFLSGKYRRNQMPEENSRRKEFDFPPINKEKAFNIIDVMNELGKTHNASVAQVALAWLLHQKVVSSVIIGVKNETQLKDNLKSTEITFTEDGLRKLDEVSKLDPEYPGWMVDFMQQDRIVNQ